MSRRRPRRWIRAVAPLLVLAAFWLVTAAAHLLEEPNFGNAGTLSPTGAGPDGSSALAALVAQRGVTIERVTSTQAALDALSASQGVATTVFVPAPDLLRPGAIGNLSDAAGGGQVVIVRPGWRAIALSGLPVYPQRQRWAAKTVAGDCSAPIATTAGRATVFRSAYAVDVGEISLDCYHGALIGVRVGGAELVVVGATDPFRNSRIDEYGNAALATELLTRQPKVVWVDVHAREPLGLKVQIKLPTYRRPDQNRTSTGWPTIDAFPSWLWAGIALALISAVLLAVARGRRLGPPVAEPLPVVVPAAETVTGRGRLYQRIRAREATLEALRAAAIRQISRLVSPHGTPEAGRPKTAEGLVDLVVSRTHLDAARVRAALAGPAPEDDDELAAMVADLDALVAAVRSKPSTQPDRTDRDPGGHE